MGPKSKKVSVHRQIQCRNNQRRYRAEAKAHLEMLEQSVDHLTKETARLEGHLESLSQAVLRLPPVPRVFAEHIRDIARCQEYWEILSHGYAINNPYRESQQIQVIRNLMDDNLLVMGVYGVEKVISNWKQYAMCFKTLHKVSKSWDIVQVDDNTRIVKGIGTITLRIGRETIGTLCPQILNDEQLMQRLIGQEIVCPIVQLFYMCAINGRDMVTQVDTDLNMTVGLTTLLGNIRDVINVMDGVQLKDGAELTCWIPPSRSLPAPELVYNNEYAR